jgi:hypothetical protein
MTLQNSIVFKNLFNLTFVTLAKNKNGFGSIRLLSSISEDKSNTDKKNKRSSIIQDIIYGNPEIREEENQAHSKLIARGKYVHEIQSIYSIYLQNNDFHKNIFNQAPSFHMSRTQDKT